MASATIGFRIASTFSASIRAAALSRQRRLPGALRNADQPAFAGQAGQRLADIAGQAWPRLRLRPDIEPARLQADQLHLMVNLAGQHHLAMVVQQRIDVGQTG